MSDVCFISYPYSPKGSKALDKIAYHLTRHIQYKEVVEAGERPNAFISNLPSIVQNEINLTRKLRKSKGKLFHALHPLGAKTALVLNKRPLITNIWDIYPFFLKNHPYFRWFWKLAIKKSDHIITSSQTNRQYIMEKFGVDSTVIYEGVDLEKFHPMNVEKIYDILYLGPKIALRGYYDILKVCGKLGLNCFLGDYYVPEKDLPLLYNQAKIFAHPTAIGFSTSHFEAMACGVPVIASRTFEAHEYLGDATVYAFWRGEIEEKVVELLKDEKLRQEYSRKGLQRVKEFSVERMVNETRNLYESLK